jgi:hypothetical protein
MPRVPDCKFEKRRDIGKHNRESKWSGVYSVSSTLGCTKKKGEKTMLKKVAVVFAFSCLVAGAAYAGSAAKTGINGSMHDINQAAGYTDDALQRTCVFCHTPHNAQSTALSPLWNHAPSTVTLPAYTWQAPLNSTIAFAPDPLIGPSRLCMACHDGITAVDSHGTAASTPVGTTVMTSSYLDGLGNTAKRYIDDLTVTHPIGFLYADAVTARPVGELVPATTGFIADGQSATLLSSAFNTNSRSLTYTSKKINNTLYGGFVTCATCHEVHNTTNAAPQAPHTYNYFLQAQEEGSAICLSCHVK